MVQGKSGNRLREIGKSLKWSRGNREIKELFKGNQGNRKGNREMVQGKSGNRLGKSGNREKWSNQGNQGNHKVVQGNRGNRGPLDNSGGWVQRMAVSTDVPENAEIWVFETSNIQNSGRPLNVSYQESQIC